MSTLAPPADLGVCCSGGGIRAAAFALGALDQLERAGIMDRARWLAAVSGGNYAATSWTLARAGHEGGTAAADVVDWLNTPIQYSKAPRHRFLRNGPGGLGRSLIAALVYIAFNIAVLGALVAAIAWPVGRLIGSPAIQPRFHALSTCQSASTIRQELWFRPSRCSCSPAIVLLVSALPSWETSWLWRPAALLAAVGTAVGLLTVVFPWAITFVGNWVRSGDHSFRAASTGLAALFGALGIVWRLARKPVLGRFAAKLPYLGGLLLAVAALVWAGKVATDAATGVGLLSTTTRWLLVVAAFVAVYLFVGITHPSIHRIYRKRLRRSFGVRRGAGGRLYAPTSATRSPGSSSRRRTPSSSSAAPISATASPPAGCPPTRSRSRAARCASAATSRPPIATSPASPPTSSPSAPWRRGWRRRAPPSPRRWAASPGARPTR